MDDNSVAETCERCGRPYALLIPEAGSDDLDFERVTTLLGACVDCGRLVGRRCCWNADGSCVDCVAQRAAAGDTPRSFAAAGMARAAVRKLDGLAPRFSAVEQYAHDFARDEGVVDDVAWARAWLAAARLRTRIDGLRRAAAAWIGRLPTTDVQRADDLRADLTAIDTDIELRWASIREALRVAGGRVGEVRHRGTPPVAGQTSHLAAAHRTVDGGASPAPVATAAPRSTRAARSAPSPARQPVSREPVEPAADRPPAAAAAATTTVVVVSPVDRVAIPVGDLMPLGGGLVTTRAHPTPVGPVNRTRESVGRVVTPSPRRRAIAPPVPTATVLRDPAERADHQMSAPARRRSMIGAALAFGAVLGGMAVIGIALVAGGVLPGRGDEGIAEEVPRQAAGASSGLTAPPDTVRPSTVVPSATPEASGGSIGAPVSVDRHPVGPIDPGRAPFAAATGGAEIVPIPSALDRSLRLHDGSGACLELPTGGTGVSFDVLLEGVEDGRLGVSLPTATAEPASVVLDIDQIPFTNEWLRLTVVLEGDGAVVSARDSATGASTIERHVALAGDVRALHGAACFEAGIEPAGGSLLLDHLHIER